MKPQFTKFTHKTPHLGKKQHQLDPNLDMKQLVHHATVQYVDRDADGDVDIYDNPKKSVPDENPIKDFDTVSKKLIAKQKGELKHTRRGMAYEDLRKWFGTGGEGGVDGGGWDRYNTKGERIGKCAREPGEGKPKCLSKEKAAKMSKDEIAAAVRRKRKADPVADRPGKGGKPKMVSNKIEEQMGSVRYCPKCQKNEMRSECAYGARYWDMFSMPPSIMTDQSKYDIAQLHPTNEEKDPCWTGYKQVGMKKKGGKKVPNCVPEHTGIVGKILEQIAGEEELQNLEEKNVPTNPSLWSKMKSRAKAKFDVYPSAYANGWAAKEYKKAGGGWKSVDENVTIEDASGKTFAEVIDIVNPDPLVPKKSENELEEAVRIPAKTGNLMHVMLTWKGKVYSLKMFFPQVSTPNRKDVQDQIEKVYPGSRVQSYHVTEYQPGEPIVHTEDWQKVNKQDKTDGMSPAAVKAYRRENPGSKLKTAVTGDPKPGSKDAERRASYCRRSKGQQDMHNIDCSKTPDKAICKARRRWKC
jgi:hypothetical protein